jgi:hypothetical protein
LLFMGALAARDAMQGAFAERWKDFINNPRYLLLILLFALIFAAGFAGGLALLRAPKRAPGRMHALVNLAVAGLLRD